MGRAVLFPVIITGGPCRGGHHQLIHRLPQRTSAGGLIQVKPSLWRSRGEERRKRTILVTMKDRVGQLGVTKPSDSCAPCKIGLCLLPGAVHCWAVIFGQYGNGMAH